MIINTSPEPWASFERWLVNHGWPGIDVIDDDDFSHALDLYGEWKPEMEPGLDL